MFKLKVDNNLNLALIQHSFAEEYFNIISSQLDYLKEYLPWVVYTKSKQYCLEFITKSLHDYADGKSLTCSIIFENKIIGNVGFNKINYSTKKAEIGYWLRQDYQGRGIMTKSLSKLIDYGFENYNLDIVQISAAVNNKPSRKVCERLGFNLNGMIPNQENVNGKILDHAIYTLKKPV